MATQLHFGAVIKIPANSVDPRSMDQAQTQQFLQQWEQQYAASRPAPPPPAGSIGGKPPHPPKPPGPLEQFAIRKDNGDLYIANGEHAVLLKSMPQPPEGKIVKFDVIA